MRGAGDLNNFCRVYDPSETEGTLGSTKTVWTERGTAWVRFLPSHMTLKSYGAGEAERGVREIEFRRGAGIRERSGLTVEAGPGSGTRWRVLSVDQESAARQGSAIVEPYTGAFE